MSEQQEFDYVKEQMETAAREKQYISVIAEENLLHNIFKKPVYFDEVSDALTASDFGDKDLGCVYYAMEQLRKDEQHIDYTSVHAYIQQRFPNREKRIFDRLMSIVGFREYGSGGYESVQSHVKIIKDLAARRNAIEKFEKLVGGLRDPTKDISDTLSELNAAVDAIDQDEADWMGLATVGLNTFDYVERRQKSEIKAVPTGIKMLDRMLGGFFATEMTVVAARPSVGKSAFGANIALAAAKAGFKVGIVSCEMTDIGFGQRLMSRTGKVNGSTIRSANLNDSDWDGMSVALNAMNELPIEFLFNCNVIEDVVKTVRHKVKKHELDVLIVDYIGIMQTRKNFKEERYKIAYISAQLCRLAKTMNIPVIALCQVNRDAHGQMPTMAQLRDSGSIEQDADGIIFLHRPETHEDKTINPKDLAGFYANAQNGNVYISINVAKQRNGSTGLTNILFHPETMEYIDILRMEDEG